MKANKKGTQPSSESLDEDGFQQEDYMKNKKGFQPSIDVEVELDDCPDRIPTASTPIHCARDQSLERIIELEARDHVPVREWLAAKAIYERLLTSVTFAEDLLPNPSASDILVVFQALQSMAEDW